jgi:seryl-tRNA synthetase
MIDQKLLRETPDLVRASQRARRHDATLVDTFLEADAAWRSATQQWESSRAEQKAFGQKVKTAQGAEKQELVAQAKELAASVKGLQASADDALAARDRVLWSIPNLVAGAPEGLEEDFEVVRTVGEIPAAPTGGSAPDHLEIAERLRAIDMERGAKVAGSRFYFLTGVGARLDLALTQMAVDRAVQHGFSPMITPTLVLPEIMAGTGFLGEHADEVYHLATDDLYLVGTSEVALAGYHKDEVLDLSDGPLKYAGVSTCYRREAGSYGKDTRGIIRVHQFNKVEMFVYCSPEDAEDQHRALLAMEEDMLGAIEVPYRVIDTAAGDLGTSAARKFDCEAWLPSQQAFRELTSTSNCTQFQARRLNTRERDADGALRPVATLNGTLATTRWIAAILENHARPDGSVVVPEALRPFLGGLEVLEPVD